jgi:polysaccharide export outer membrane protein
LDCLQFSRAIIDFDGSEMLKGIFFAALLVCLPVVAAQQAGKTDGQGAESSKSSTSSTTNSETAGHTPPSATAADANYVIGPEDLLLVKVWREPDLSGQHMVRPDGKISLPLVNEVEAAGQTPVQLAETITKSLSKFMNAPEVSVSVQTINSKFYFLQGEVLKPGKYPLLIPTTVLQALVNAGGFQEFANRKKIVVVRGETRHKFNYNDVIKGKNLDQNITLVSGDLIIVP